MDSDYYTKYRVYRDYVVVLTNGDFLTIIDHHMAWNTIDGTVSFFTRDNSTSSEDLIVAEGQWVYVKVMDPEWDYEGGGGDDDDDK